MNKLNNQKNQIIILAVLLLILGVANYINYYAPPKPTQKVLSISDMSQEELNDFLSKTTKNNKSDDKSEKIFENKQPEKERVTEKIDASSYLYSDNYLNYAIDSNGKLVKWNKKNIAVFVSESEYKNAIFQALSAYNEAFKNYFAFSLARNRENSDIKIDVVDAFDSNAKKDSIYVAGLTNNSFSGEDKHLTHSIIQILSKKPNSQVKLTNSEVYRVTLHELGHAIGIIGHSPKNTDVMFASSSIGKFSSRDIATIKIMYSNNENLIKNETKNYAQTKLKEAELYAQRSPNKAISWVNLGRVYYDLNKKEEALGAYKKALTLEPENPLIYQSMGECYYSSGKYSSAIKFYKLAMNYYKTNEEKITVYNMLGMSFAKMENYNDAYVFFKEAYKYDSNNRMLLKNYLVSCVETDRKQEAVDTINSYKAKFPDIINDEFIKDVLKWSGTK